MLILVVAGSFVALSSAVALGRTRDLDATVLTWTQAFASPAIDLFASVVTVTGRAELTALIALLLAILWSRREGATGWAPLALFVAIAAEAIFKYVIPHAPPPSSVLRDYN